MPTTYRRYQPDQPFLLPPDLQEWVPRVTSLTTSATWLMHWT